jgi:CRISPR-associated protein Cas1
MDRLRHHWANSRALKDQGFTVDLPSLDAVLAPAAIATTAAPDHVFLLTEEARLTKQLYRLACRATSYGDFTRSKRGESTDSANQFLDHGNYLAYGLGATATWVLGLPHSLAVLHGKTRRGGLVFDVADLVKDAVILPQAFASAIRGHSEQDFRHACIEALTQTEALDFMIDTLKTTAVTFGRIAEQQMADLKARAQ